MNEDEDEDEDMRVRMIGGDPRSGKARELCHLHPPPRLLRKRQEAMTSPVSVSEQSLNRA